MFKFIKNIKIKISLFILRYEYNKIKKEILNAKKNIEKSLYDKFDDIFSNYK